MNISANIPLRESDEQSRWADHSRARWLRIRIGRPRGRYDPVEVLPAGLGETQPDRSAVTGDPANPELLSCHNFLGLAYGRTKLSQAVSGIGEAAVVVCLVLNSRQVIGGEPSEEVHGLHCPSESTECIQML